MNNELNIKLDLIYRNLLINITKIQNTKFFSNLNMWVKNTDNFYNINYNKTHAKYLLNKVYETLLSKNVKNLKINKTKCLITYDFKKTKINININSINKGQIGYIILRQ
jgi:hypothetical protein